MEKHRHVEARDTIEILSMSGEVKGDTAILIDDVISTGSTVIENANALKKKGVKKIIVAATHGVFAADALQKLEKSLIDKIIVTDSVAQTVKSSKVEVISVAGLIANCLVQEL